MRRTPFIQPLETTMIASIAGVSVADVKKYLIEPLKKAQLFSEPIVVEHKHQKSPERRGIRFNLAPVARAIRDETLAHFVEQRYGSDGKEVFTLLRGKPFLT